MWEEETVMEAHEEILVQEAGSVCTLVIHRPEKRNILTPGCLGRIRDILNELAQQDRVRAVVIRGSGTQAFSAGYDLFALPKGDAVQAEDLRPGSSPMEEALQSMESFPFPLIAMINGDAYGGGCELAMGCDIRIAAYSIKMGMPPARLGLVYPCSGYLRFLRVIGFSRALELFLSGKSYGSEACLRMGLVNQVAADEALGRVTYELAEQIATNAPLSLKGTKRALYRLTESLIPEHVVQELHALFVQSLNSEDLIEAQRAFAQKRPPRFEGK
jgi:enoyl-CoA hydratase/carnithine racemase